MSKVEQRPVIGIVPTQVPDEDIVRVYGPDGLVEAIEVRDRTFMMGVQWHPEYTWKTLETDFNLWKSFVEAAAKVKQAR